MNISTYYSALVVFVQLARLKLTGRRAPFFVTLQVTKFCDLRCSYCFAELETLRGTSDFTTEQWKGIIDELHVLGTRWIRLQGGEPLIRNDIGELVDYIKNKGMLCELVTNGTQLKRKINSLTHLDSLCISLDGDRAANDRCRGKGVYDKVLESINVAKAYGIKTRIHGVLTRCSVDSLEHLISLCNEIGIKFNVAGFHLDENKKVNGLALTGEEIKEYYKKYLALKRKGSPISSSYLFINHILHWPQDKGETLYTKDLELLKERNLIRCMAGRYACFIDSDGSLYTCPKRWKKGLNISRGIQRAWDASGDLDCISCWAYGDNEAYALFNFSPAAIWNAVGYITTLLKRA